MTNKQRDVLASELFRVTSMTNFLAQLTAADVHGLDWPKVETDDQERVMKALMVRGGK